MREKSRVEMRPIRRHSDTWVIEAGRHWIHDERDPKAYQDRETRPDLYAHGCPGEQEQKDVAQTDLRQRVLKRPISLLGVQRSQEDSEEDQHDAAPHGMSKHAAEALAGFAAIGNGKRKRCADQKREGRLNQIM